MSVAAFNILVCICCMFIRCSAPRHGVERGWGGGWKGRVDEKWQEGKGGRYREHASSKKSEVHKALRCAIRYAQVMDDLIMQNETIALESKVSMLHWHLVSSPSHRHHGWWP